MEIIVEPNSGREIYVEEDELYNFEWQGVSIGSIIGYDTLNAIQNRASIEEVIEFANKVRKAGGGNLIDRLMPSVPEEPNSCLIANALNFDCEVNSTAGVWYMEVEDGDLGEKIADELGLNCSRTQYDAYTEFCQINLPHEIAYVAQAFDSYRDVELENFNI